jgi:hypothetical protein
MTTEPRTDDRGRPLCEGLTKRRTRCLATALPDSPAPPTSHMPWCDAAAHTDSVSVTGPILCAGPAVQLGKHASLRLREDERYHTARINLDTSSLRGASLTPKQARELAAQLVALADTAEGRGPE